MNVGDRVALNFTLLDTEGRPARVNDVGMVIGHMGELPLVELDHGESSVGGRRVVVWEQRAFRLVRVAHPGKPRRSRPRKGEIDE